MPGHVLLGQLKDGTYFAFITYMILAAFALSCTLFMVCHTP